jgi:hypothetical protein
MSLLKYIERLKRMDDLIRRKATGTPDEFARRLGVGKTALMEELRDFRLLGADLYYCKSRKSYCYKNEFVLKIGNVDKSQQKELKGGGILAINSSWFGNTALK